MINKYADILLPLPFGDVFAYSIPPQFRSSVDIGMRVIVHFGARKIYSGIICHLYQEIPLAKFDIKDIDAVLDEEPVVNISQLKLWQWMADYYCCSPGDVYKTALPSAMKMESRTKIKMNPEYRESDDFLEKEKEVLNLLEIEGQVTLERLYRVLGKRVYSVVKNLLKKNVIRIEENLFDPFTPKKSWFVFLGEQSLTNEKITEALDSLKRAKKQFSLFQLFLSLTIYSDENKQTCISKKELLKQSGLSDGILKALVVKGVLRMEEVETGRLDLEKRDEDHRIDLNEFQQQSFDDIKKIFLTKKPVLLHGVTSSGKTEIYIKLIEEELRWGRQVLYLVPEIGLTTQLTQRLKKVFGNKVGVYHSGFSDAERVEIWQEIKKGNQSSYRIILGTRSSMFLPFKDLGLIIVDEEHENSYKQFDTAPRYNARDLAVVMGKSNNANVLLGTATPSFESYYNAKIGKYGLVELKKRYRDAQLPEIKIADIRRATYKKQMHSILTPELYDEIVRALKDKEQIILFQNRRGFAPYLQCSSCGDIPKCKHCDVSLTYHKQRSSLVCHYCGYTIPVPLKCDSCGSGEYKMRGFGTEKIEEDIKALFPDARIARMDLDTTRAKRSYERIIHKLETGQIDILIGTQMVTNGLDLDNVSVVGILDADQILNYPDFRSYEKSFQLMAQVSGRAGRKNKPGKVFIQTTQPEHPVLINVLKNDFEYLFLTQMKERKLFHYPPYTRLVKIILRHRDYKRADYAASALSVLLKRQFNGRVLGPESPVIGRVQNWFRKEIWVKIEKDNSMKNKKNEIMEDISRIKSLPNNSGLIISVDVDPF